MQTVPILIVDDNATNLKLARILLESEGLTVRCAENAEAALELLEAVAPQLILMDVQLPGMDGLELTRRLRREPRWDRTWIIAVTAYAMKGDEAKALAAGCDGYVTKPIDTEGLTNLVRLYLASPRAGS